MIFFDYRVCINFGVCIVCQATFSIFDIFFCSYLIVIPCLLSNTAMGFGVEVIARSEQRNLGINWSNFFTPLSVDEHLSLGIIYGILLLDTIVYMFLAW